MTAVMLTRAAAAKVNLTLELTGRRGDGYHTLQSLVVFTDIADHLTFTPAKDLSLRIGGPEAGSLAADGSNLVLRAAELAQNHIGRPAGISIDLEKHIPLQAGLGGGSADAAAALSACLEAWSGEDAQPISDEALAFGLGADVPVCRYGKAAMMRGIGEVIAPVAGLPPAWLVLVNPRVSVPTADVFRAYDGSFSREDTGPSGLETFDALSAYVLSRGNDLTSAAERVAPAIGEILRLLQTTRGCAVARMSGSGPTCFGLYEARENAQHAAETLAAKHPAWWVRPARIVS